MISNGEYSNSSLLFQILVEGLLFIPQVLEISVLSLFLSICYKFGTIKQVLFNGSKFVAYERTLISNTWGINNNPSTNIWNIIENCCYILNLRSWMYNIVALIHICIYIYNYILYVCIYKWKLYGKICMIAKSLKATRIYSA